MSGDWKAGDVGVSAGDERFIVTGKGDCFWPGEEPRGWSDVSGQPVGDDRRLVVIDPEDAEQVKRLTMLHLACYGVREGAKPEAIEERHMAAALREFADPKPPKPAEPQGLGAVVKCDPGPVYDRAWAVRLWAGDTFPGPAWDWHDSSGNGGRRHYADLPVLSIFTEGVTTDLGGE